MSQVREAGALPERHLYEDPDETEGEDAEDSGGATDDCLTIKNAAKISFKVFLSRLVGSAKVYGELVLVKTGDAKIDRHLRNLRMIKAVQTYGFLMHLRVGGCGDKQFLSILRLTESFVLRRHVCRERSNETEALFARLCSVDSLSPIAATREAYRDLCPPDEKFQEEFAVAKFTSNVIDRARFCLEQIELSMHGEYDELQVLGADDVHVEHIIPQKIKTRKAIDEYGDWVTYLGESSEIKHEKFVSRIGNLTLFAGALNIGASNNPFQREKHAYKESGIKLTQDLLDLPQFKFKNVENRSEELASTAVQLWPMP